jgi:hypothetical protein
MLHMILLNVNAESLVIEEVEWQKVIETARACTWTPRGTLAPPIDMEQPAVTGWDGRYYPPVGQEVTRADAAALGQALAGAPTQGPRAVMLQAYCRKGGFVITKPAAPGELQIDSLLALAAHMEPSQAPEFAEAPETAKVRVLTRP